MIKLNSQVNYQIIYIVYYFVILFQEKNKPQGDVTQSPRAMAKFLKEAARVKQVLSANSEIFAQVSMVLLKTFLSERSVYCLA